MKTVTLLTSIAILAFTASGCSTVSNDVNAITSLPSADIYAISLRAVVASTATLALQKNPSYVPLTRTLADGIDAAISQNAQITPEGIAAFVHSVTAKNNLPEIDAALFTTLAQQIYAVYSVKFKTQVVQATDPNARLFIDAFKTGLRDALANVSVPTPAVGS